MRVWLAAALCLCAGTVRSDPVLGHHSTTVRDFGAAGDGVTDDTAAQQAMATAVAQAGGTIYYPRGRYLTSQPVLLASNTGVRCDAGAVIASSSDGVGPLNFFRNLHADAISLTDHDISIEGCSFEFAGDWRTPKHAIALHFVQHASIRFNRFHGGGNATAIVGSDDIETIGNVATDIHNACYDHWEGSSNLRVTGNACYLGESVAGAFGITGTGLSTSLADTPVTGLQIIGNRIFETGTQGACIQLNSSATSPVTRAQIIGNFCSIVSRDNAPGGISLAGAGGYNVVSGNIVEGANSNPAIQEVDGTQHDNLFSGNLLIACGFAQPHRANLELNGIGGIVTGNKLSGCAGRPIYTTDDATVVLGNDFGDGPASLATLMGSAQTASSGRLFAGSGRSSSLFIQTGSIQPAIGGVGHVTGSGGTYIVEPHVIMDAPSPGGVQGNVAITDWGLSIANLTSDGGMGCTAGTLLKPAGGDGTPAYVIVTAVDEVGRVTVLSPYVAGDYSHLPSSTASLVVVRGLCKRVPVATLGYYIEAAAVTNPGMGYISAPKIEIVGGLGSGGSITAELAGPLVNYFGVPACALAVVGALCAQGKVVQIK